MNISSIDGRFRDKTPTREQLIEWDRHHVWHAFTQMAEYEPLVIERAQGCTLIDIDGREYLDGVSSLWCNVHGHRHPRIDAAVREQLDRVAHVTSLGSSNPTTIRLARRLAELAPGNLQHVFFSDDGATANEAAIKIAVQYWRQCSDPRPQKTCFLKLEEAYHGDTIGCVSVGAVDQFHTIFEPLLFETITAATPHAYRAPAHLTPEQILPYYLGQLEDLLIKNHHRLAAMIVEPLVQGAAGMIVHPPGYLRGVRELTAKYGVLLIADEVAVGMGRTGRLFACEHEDVVPDLLCVAKGITGGYLPLAATITTPEIFQAFLGDYSAGKTFFHGHTYGGNPLGAAAALATLDVFEEEETLKYLEAKIERLREHLRRIGELEHVGDVRQRGFVAGVELVRDRATKEPYPWRERRGAGVCLHARRSGVLLRPLGNVVVIMPPLSVTLEELDRICRAVYEGIAATT